MSLKLKNVRLAFPQLWVPKNVKNETDPAKKAYSASFLIPKNDKATLDAVRDAMMHAAVDKWGTRGNDMMRALFKKDMTCLHDGAEKADKYDGFDGSFFISARNKVRPRTLDSDKTEVSAESGVIYAGCYVVAILDIWAQGAESGYQNRINATLLGVQKFRDGDAFGGSRAASMDEFDDLSMDDTSGGGEDPSASSDDMFG
jgi:hypothetical protein